MSMESTEPNDKVAERTETLAAGYGNSVYWSRIHDLTAHVVAGRLSPEALSSIAAAEEEAAIEQYKLERQAGLHNDTKSLGNGLSTIVKGGPKYRLEKHLDTLRDQARLPFPLPGSYEEIPDSDFDSPLYRMRLPRGVFFMDDAEDPRFIRFHTDGIVAYGNVMTPEGYRINANTYEVIRIEGDHGELWQNPTYTSDGQPRRLATRVLGFPES